MRGVMLAAVLLVLVACTPPPMQQSTWQPTEAWNPDGYSPTGAAATSTVTKEGVPAWIGTWQSTRTEQRMIVTSNTITVEQFPEPQLYTYHSYNPAEERILVTVINGPRAGERLFYSFIIYSNNIAFGNPPEMFALISR